MPDLTAYATAGLFTESEQADFVAYVSGGVFAGYSVVVVSRQEYLALHRWVRASANERRIDMNMIRVVELFAEGKIIDMNAPERLTDMVADDRLTELCAIEELTWS
jgi:hypothetical protein